MSSPDRRLLLVHAHPDDESIYTGATMARYAAEGARVTLVTCTLGELGEIIPPSLAYLAAEKEDRLGAYRTGELTAACAALGVSDHRFLGGPGRWRDSGMMGTPITSRPTGLPGGPASWPAQTRRPSSTPPPRSGLSKAPPGSTPALTSTASWPRCARTPPRSPWTRRSSPCPTACAARPAAPSTTPCWPARAPPPTPRPTS